MFIPILWRAVARGFVSHTHASFVHNGLREGFDLGFLPDRFHGRRFFHNYSSALEAHAAVSDNLYARLESQKSYSLFPLDPRSVRDSLSSFLPAWCVFPLGAVAKPNEPGAFRPISDHSRTGFNDASDDTRLRHSLTSVPAIARLLRAAFHMAVDDVDAAFPLLPLKPTLWPFFIFAWTHPSKADEVWLHWHVCGDFGAKGLPGTFKIFFSDVVIGMARSEGALTLPMVIHVDDTALIGEDAGSVDRESESFSGFLAPLGIPLKRSKHKPAARVQFVLGFWWDSVARTRALAHCKVLEYASMLVDCASRRSLSLRELQRAAGRMQRAVLTLPPGASCLLANVFALMRGLLRPSARRRLTKACAEDFKLIVRFLELNRGSGYFAFDRFALAAPVATDASKSSRYVGGGYLSACGRHSWWQYGPSAARKPIDVLEGDTVVKAACDLGHLWSNCRVPLLIDNQAFQQSARRGWSRAARLSLLVRQLFFISIRCRCVFEFHWLSTHDNIFADALSRPNPHSNFLALVASMPHLLDRGMVLRVMPGAGEVRGVSDSEDPLWAVSTRHPPGAVGAGELDTDPTASPPTCCNLGPAFSSDVAGDGPPSDRLRRCKRRAAVFKAPRRDFRATLCPVCGSPARWSCTLMGPDGSERRCDAVRCLYGCTSSACFCSTRVCPSASAVSARLASVSVSISCAMFTSFSRVVRMVTAEFVLLGASSSSPQGCEVIKYMPSAAGRAPVNGGVQVQRASIFVGLPSSSVLGCVDDILSDRLSPSTLSSMKAALAHWSLVAARHMWPRVIVADDPLRGGKLATFVVYLVQETSVKATSIQNYVWALRMWFKHQRQPDPVPGVLEWDDFMRAVAVVAWVRSEPRKAVPLSLIRDALRSVDTAVFWEVQAALLIVMLFFTFSRSESPCPRAFSGPRSFDVNKHTQVRDVEVRSAVSQDSRIPYVAWRLKSIKQDPRMERPEASGNQDWTFVGDAAPPFSVIHWLHLFWIRMPLSAEPRTPESPFFRDHSGERVLTYSQAVRDVRALWSRVVSPEEAESYGLHGLRVGAYNLARAHDPALAVAQGGWASQAHTRYERFSIASVLSLPSRMTLGDEGLPVPESEAFGDEVTHPFTPPERPVVARSGGRLGRARSGEVGGGASLGPRASGALSPSVVAALVRVRAQLTPSADRGLGTRSPLHAPACSSPIHAPACSSSIARSAAVAHGRTRSSSAPRSVSVAAPPGSSSPVRPLPVARNPSSVLPSLGTLGTRASSFAGRYGA